MPALGLGTIMIAMTPTASSTKVLLVPDSRSPAVPAAVPLRRYRIARLRFEGAAPEPGRRFDHLRRSYD